MNGGRAAAVEGVRNGCNGQHACMARPRLQRSRAFAMAATAKRAQGAHTAATAEGGRAQARTRLQRLRTERAGGSEQRAQSARRGCDYYIHCYDDYYDYYDYNFYLPPLTHQR